MATYADLSAYQRAAAQPVVNPLESLIQGFSTGQAIQRLPQTIQEQELMRQLNVAIAQQKLRDIQDPNAAISRRIQEELAVRKALNPNFDTEQALATAGLAAKAREQGVFAAPTVAGQPAALPALPVAEQVQRQIIGEPTLQPGQEGFIPAIEQAVSPLAAPVVVGRRQVFDPETQRAQQMRQQQLTEAEKRRQTPLKSEKIGNVLVFSDPFTGAVVSRTEVAPNEDLFDVPNLGSFVGVKDRPETWKPIPGSQKPSPGAITKLSEGEKQFLSSASSQSNALKEMVDTFDALEKEGKAGFIGGKTEALKSFAGLGDEEFSQANARIKGSLFGLARALQGGGVLTEQDIARMEDLVPSLGVVRPQFVGSLKGVAQIMLDKIRGFKESKGSVLDTNSKQVVDLMQNKLEAFIGGKEATGGSQKNDSGKIIIIAPDGIPGNWPVNKPIPPGFTKSK